ncbi:MAG: prolyl oligopeptidase family serine peptidase [Actinomycetota bacterium]
MSDMPTWKRRYLAPRIDAVTWASQQPDRLGVISTEGSSSQAWAWDLSSGERRQISAEGVGAEEVHLLPDGSGVVWWLDPVGDERGRWLVTPFAGGAAEPLLPGVPDGWSGGLSLAGDTIAVGLVTDDDYRVLVSIDGEPARELYRHASPAGVGREYPAGTGGLSANGALVCIRHSEHGDIERTALRILDVRSGAMVGDQLDEGRMLAAGGWSPVAGDLRLVVSQEVTGIERPAIWDLSAGSREAVALPDLPGPVTWCDWWPDASALLLHHEAGGRQQLLRAEMATGAVTTLLDEPGTIEEAGVRPDGTVWFRHDTGATPPVIRDLAGREVLSLGTEPAPLGRPYVPIAFANPDGEQIHGFVITPEGSPPFPAVIHVHGGPNWHDRDEFEPDVQAFVDAGYAVLLVNYRGSTGRDTAFRERLRGDIGFPESQDILAGLDHVVAEGLVDPDRVILEGWSWGGYLALLNAGLHPDRWQAVLGGIPVGDSVAAHYECAPPLRDWDIATMGGSPMEVPVLFRERNPMTYVDRVRAPVLLIAGEHDSRCPLGQVMVYAHALRARRHPVDVYLYAAGHHANDVNEKIRHMELALAFFAQHVPADATP